MATGLYNITEESFKPLKKLLNLFQVKIAKISEDFKTQTEY